ncbi:MAG: ABC transporter ATP-binding protein [Desulfobacterales bacterium]|nr:MAG: ABC transporter ATP-binding protein [Desulfobacterales bacterium]
MHLLEAKGLQKYFGGLAATRNVDFHIQEGEIVGLIGPNGAGKTTLFNLISGSLVPDGGTIKFRGQEIGGLKPHQICRRGIARTFQLVKLFGQMTVFENVYMGCRFGRRSESSARESGRQARALLDFVGLAGRENMIAGDLTMVNQKRLEIARALATGPQLLLLDEVMAGLNPSEVDQAIELVQEIRDQKITVFMIEHVMKAIMKISDRILALHFGTKIAEGIPRQVAADKTVLEVYLGVQSNADA